MYPIRLTRSLPLLVFLGALLSAVAGAQTPGIPVLQNGFLNPGLAIAADFGGGGGQSFAGLAGAWGLGASARSGSARIQLSAAAGAGRANGAVRGAYGGRATFAAWSSAGGTLGIGAFAGMGGAPRTRANGTVNNAAVLMVPAGVTVGYRRPLGATRGMSIYASPMYSWVRTSTDVSTVSSGGFRAAVGFDFAFSPSLGATIGGEFGATQFKTTTGKGGSGTFGAAISFVPGRRGGGAQ